MPVPVTRRVVLAGGALVTLGGCGGTDPENLVPKPDVAVLLGAIASEEMLISLYETVTAVHTGLPQAVTDALQHHREHLGVLRRHYVPGTGSATATPGSTPTSAAPPAGLRDALTALRSAEKKAAAARAEDVAKVSPGIAQLLASIGAYEAGHATALGLL